MLDRQNRDSMKTHWFLITLMTLAQFVLQSPLAQKQQETSYAETRKLLLRMERNADNKALKKLFEQGEERIHDLIRALSDPDKTVSVNSQLIIKYLSQPEGITAVEKWIADNQQQKRGYSMPEIVPPPYYEEGTFLAGEEKDLTKLVLRNWHFASDEERSITTATLIAYNKDRDKALIAVTVNCVPLCGICWYVTVGKEGDRWRYLSASLVWQS